MEKLTIYQFQAEQIENTLRLVSNLLKSQNKTTCLDRDIMQSWQMVKNVIEGNPDKRVSRI